jgi:hypothetical protein
MMRDNFANGPSQPPRVTKLRLANERQLRRWQRLESALCRCGATRLIFELLKELIRHGLIEEAEIDRRLDSFARLDSSSLPVVDADHMPPILLNRIR